MEYKNGELLYVCKKDRNWQDGLYVLYRDKYEVGYDTSLLEGLTIYEEFIVCEYLNSRDRVDFGRRTWRWRPVNGYIKELQSKLNEIQKISNI